VKLRIKNLQNRPKCSLVKIPTGHGRSSQIVISQNVKYVPPTHGSVFVRVIESFDISSDKEEATSPLTDSQVLVVFVLLFS
jgi:hypothetical protein